MKKSIFLFSAIAFGILFPQGHSYAYLIRYFIMLILFCSLLDLKIDLKSALNPRLGTVIAMMMAIGGLTAWIGNWFNPELALVAFIIAMAPTAAAAPVMTRFLQGRVDYVMSSVVVTNCFSAIALPLVLPMLNPGEQIGINLVALLNTLAVVLLPLVLTQLLQTFASPVVTVLTPYKGAGFYFWMAAIYLATAKATHFIEAESTAPWIIIVEIAGISLALCAINFSLGRWLGGKDWGQEMGQSLGQKNTLFSIWVALTFLTPAIALGPMFYIVFQNLYNSYLLAQDSRVEKA
jgi:BASS family bile acid:Na+ symporter